MHKVPLGTLKGFVYVQVGIIIYVNHIACLSIGLYESFIYEGQLFQTDVIVRFLLIGVICCSVALLITNGIFWIVLAWILNGR